METRPAGSRLTGFLWAVVIGVGLYVIVASAIATFVGWFS
jgi:hypothetical protein